MSDDGRLRQVFTGATFIEGTRWHDGRWWFADMYADRVCSVAEDGADLRVEAEVPQPSGLGWLPDGSLLAVAMTEQAVVRVGPEGREVYADVSRWCRGSLNDMVTDDDGVAWVSQHGFLPGDDLRSAPLLRIDTDRSVHVAAEGLYCPNGIVITPDGETLIVAEYFAGRYTAFHIEADDTLTGRRLFAELGPMPTATALADVRAEIVASPDGCAMDAEGHVWGADLAGRRLVRVAPTGEVVEQFPAPAGLVVDCCALGGADGTTLLVGAAPGYDHASRQHADDASLWTTTVGVPRAGRP